MNLLEFKRFAELRRQYNYLIIDDPVGDGKYKIEEQIGESSAEPVILIFDNPDFSVDLKAIQETLSEIEVVNVPDPVGEYIGARENELLSILSDLEVLTSAPLVVIVTREKLQMDAYVRCLDSLHISVNCVMSSALKMESPLMNLVNVIRMKIQDLEMKNYAEALLAQVPVYHFESRDCEQKLKDFLTFWIIQNLLYYKVLDQDYSKIIAKLDVESEGSLFSFESEETSYLSETAAAIIYEASLSLFIAAKSKLNSLALVKLARWAKLLDYDNKSLEYLDNNDLEYLDFIEE